MFYREAPMIYKYLKRATLLGIIFAGGIWAADPAVGTWVMNAKKSVFQPGPAPRTQTRVYRESPDGITATVVTLSADGKSSTVEYPVNYDGLAHPVTGSPDIDAIKMEKTTSYRAESKLMHAGRVIATTVREVSGDQKTITITYDGTTADGGRIHNVSVYDRQ
jgi:hypothetical protein